SVSHSPYFSYRVPVIIFCYLTFASRFGLGLVGKLHGSVVLPCVCHHLPGSIEKIDVYWQWRNFSNNLVVAAAINGTVNLSFVDKMFKGRTQLDPDGLKAGNFSLSLTNLSLHDTGIYDCLILWNPSYTAMFNNSTVDLEVTAQYSTPVVDVPSSGVLQHGQEVTLRCTSEGGLEQPKIMWINANDGNEIQDGHVNTVVHLDKDVFNVTNTITLNITSNVNISCLIQTKNGNLTSQSCKMEDRQEEESSHPVLIACFIIGGLVIVLLIALLVRQQHVRRTAAYGVPPNQMSDLGSG
ncbi:hypothetical protein PRIEUP_LOCUS12121, partial [Pristimantis euphronides]